MPVIVLVVGIPDKSEHSIKIISGFYYVTGLVLGPGDTALNTLTLGRDKE